MSAGCAHGGASYGFEHRSLDLASVEYEGDPDLERRTTATAAFGAHRLRLVDISGVFFSIVSTAASARIVDPDCPPGTQGCTPDPVKELGNGYVEYMWTAKPAPVIPGMRVVIEYAWAGGDPTGSVATAVATDDAAPIEFSEWRVELGAEDHVGRFYVDVTGLDLTSRSLRVAGTSGTVIVDPFQWKMGAEGGLILGRAVRAGAFVSYDLLAAIDALFDGRPQGYVAGVAATVLALPVRIDLRADLEQTSTGGGDLINEAHGLGVSATLGLYY